MKYKQVLGMCFCVVLWVTLMCVLGYRQGIQPPIIGGPHPYIVKTLNSKIDIYLTDTIEEPNSYIELYYLIEQFPKGGEIYIHLAGKGGHVSSLMRFYNSIKISKATVNTVVDGPVASAHAVLAMMGANISLSKVGHFMFHKPAVYNPLTAENVSLGDICYLFTGKKDRGQDLKQKCVNTENLAVQEVEQMAKDVFYPYLTLDEREQIAKGFDLNITNDEMRERINMFL